MKTIFVNGSRTYVRVVSNTISEIPNNYFDTHRNVTHLELALLKLRTLFYIHLRYLEQVTFFSLTAPSLTWIDKGALFALMSLKSIYLEAENLFNLDNIFIHARSLESVTLIVPGVRVIPYDIFKKNIHLKHILIHSACFVFYSDILSNCSSLESLQINISVENQRVASIHSLKLPKLKTLTLNRINFWDDLINTEYKYLTFLNLQNSLIRRLHFLKNMPNLKYLDLSHNQIRLSSHVFSNNLKLEHLNIAFNNLTYLESYYFCKLKNLISLYVNKCTVFGCDGDFLNEDLFELKKLYLGSNYFNKITNMLLKNVVNIEVLNVSQCSIRYVSHSAFRDLECLKILDFSYNVISVFKPKVFRDLINVRHLNLEYNILLEFNVPTLFSLKRNYYLKHLNLSYNNLETIVENNFVIFLYLTNLNLSNNRLSIILNLTFSNLKHLVVLNLNCNKITTIWPEAFLNLGSLEMLNLRSNLIEEFQYGVFDSLKRLKTLDLGENLLTNMIDDLLTYNNYLKYIYLDSNKLTFLPNYYFNSNHQLTILNLAYNKLNAETFQMVFNIRSLHCAIVDNSQVELIEEKFRDKIDICS